MQRVQVRRSTTPGDRPTSLLAGELAVNLPDRLMFVGANDGSVTHLFEGASFSLPRLLDGNIRGTAFTLQQVLDGTAVGTTYTLTQLLNGFAAGTTFSLSNLLDDHLGQANKLKDTLNGRFHAGSLGVYSWLEALNPSTESNAALVALNPTGTGGAGAVFGTRTSSAPGGNCYAFGSFAINDATSPKQTAWGGYSEARKWVNSGLTIGFTVVTTNQDVAVRARPDTMLSNDKSHGLMLQAGKPALVPNNNPSAALAILGENAPWAKWLTGIIFGANSIVRADDIGFPGSVAMDLPRGYSLMWRNSLDFNTAAWIHSDVDVTATANGTAGGYLIFNNTGMVLGSRATNGVQVFLDKDFLSVAGNIFTTQTITGLGGLSITQGAVFGSDVVVAGPLSANGDMNANGQMFCNNSLAVNGIAYFNTTVGMVGQIILSSHIPIYANDAGAAAAGHPLWAVYRNSSFGNCLKAREA